MEKVGKSCDLYRAKERNYMEKQWKELVVFCIEM